MTQLYRPIIKQAAILAWRYKFLWIFGFFATALGGAGNYEIILQSLRTIGGEGFSLLEIKLFFADRIFGGLTFTKLFSYISQNPLDALLVFFTLLIMLIIVALAIWLIIISVGAIIYSVGAIHKKQKINFLGSLEKGVANFWPLLSVNILAKIATAILLFIVSIPTFYLTQNYSWYNAIFYLILFIILVATVIIIPFIAIFADAFIVLNKKKILESIKMAWALFKKNWLISVETGILLLIINFVFGLALTAIIIVLGMLLSFILPVFIALNSSVGYIAVLAFGLLLLIALMILAGSFLTTFQFSVWTMLFLRIQKKAEAKVLRLTKKWRI